MQHTADTALLRFLPQDLGLRERSRAIEHAPALDRIFDGVDAFERSFDEGDRIGLAILDRGRDLNDRARVGNKFFRGHGVSAAFRRAAVSI